MATDKDSAPAPPKIVTNVLAKDQANRALMALVQAQQAALNTKVTTGPPDASVRTNAMNQQGANRVQPQNTVPATLKKE
jgi:hypothetical protein